MAVFSFTPDQVALYFFIFFAAAVTCSLLCVLLLREVDKGIVILVSLFICSFSLLLIGPSSLLHIPARKAIVGTGLYFCGAQNLIANYAVSQVLKFTK